MEDDITLDKEAIKWQIHYYNGKERKLSMVLVACECMLSSKFENLSEDERKWLMDASLDLSKELVEVRDRKKELQATMRTINKQ